MDEPIIPEHVRRRQNRLRSSFRGRQLSLIAFTLAAIAGLVYAAYYFFPKEEQFVLGFYIRPSGDCRFPGNPLQPRSCNSTLRIL